MNNWARRNIGAWALRLWPLASRLAPLLTGGCALAVYLLTMAPTLAWGHDFAGRDSGDFISAAWFLGVPHPPGYPSYTILAWLFARLPWGSVAWRVHLLSGCAGAGTVTLLYLIARRLMRAADWACDLAAWGAVVGALLLGFAPLFWSHALIAEVYALHLFFIALILWLMLRWRDGDGPLAAAALAFGLGMGNHITLTFLGPTILLLLWEGRERLTGRQLLLSALALTAGLSVYLYLPWRAATDPIINWGGADTRDGFWWMVSGRGYRHFFFALPRAEWLPRLDEWAARSSDQFNLVVWPLALLGLWDLARRDRWLASGSLVHAAINLVYSVGYDVSDAYVHLLPAYLYLVLWAGQGAAFLLSIAHHLREPGWRSTAVTGLVVLGLLLLPLLSLTQEWAGMDLTHDRRAQTYAQEALEAVEPGALILVDSDVHTFTLWYYYYVEGLRPDVEVVNYPMLNFDWYKRTVTIHHPDVVLPGPEDAYISKLEAVQHNLERRPVYITEEEEKLGDLQQTPAGPLWRVTRP